MDIFYRNIESKVSFCIKYEYKNRKKEVTITRLGLGKCCIDEYLAMMKILNSDKFNVQYVTVQERRCNTFYYSASAVT